MANVEVIRTDGTVERHELGRGRGLLQSIYALIGCDCIDTVNLRDGRVMLVDDNGYDTKFVDHGGGRFEVVATRARKPVNPAATRLYRAICRPGTTHQIVGDVAIVLDEEFA